MIRYVHNFNASYENINQNEQYYKNNQKQDSQENDYTEDDLEEDVLEEDDLEEDSLKEDDLEEDSIENITYSFKEDNNNNKLSMIDIINRINKKNIISTGINYYADYTLYYENNTLKQLQLMCDFYNIKTNKMRKSEIIDTLNDFEENSKNKTIVEEKKKLWFYFENLKKNKFFKKYILV
jgi:hypothetical protein